MKLPAKLTVHGEHRPVDVTDQAVAKNDVRDFPVAASADIRQAGEAGHARGFATGLAAQRLVSELGQFCVALATRHRPSSKSRPSRASMVAEPLQFAGAGLGHAAQALAGVDS